ncbi:hypothetical protein EI94DRAFT_1735736 [Lactarius quietus]|nr:hypothetical protein EI94DRAFT_1735736 [Lactarius quietus]
MVINPADKPNAAPWRTRASSLLTALTHWHGSAPYVTTFLLIQLTAPAVANPGGSALSSRIMFRLFLFHSGGHLLYSSMKRLATWATIINCISPRAFIFTPTH